MICGKFFNGEKFGRFSCQIKRMGGAKHGFVQYKVD